MLGLCCQSGSAGPLDAGEITDKGTINQRAVLARRQALVRKLYES